MVLTPGHLSAIFAHMYLYCDKSTLGAVEQETPKVFLRLISCSTVSRVFISQFINPCDLIHDARCRKYGKSMKVRREMIPFLPSIYCLFVCVLCCLIKLTQSSYSEVINIPLNMCGSNMYNYCSRLSNKTPGNRKSQEKMLKCFPLTRYIFCFCLQVFMLSLILVNSRFSVRQFISNDLKSNLSFVLLRTEVNFH